MLRKSSGTAKSARMTLVGAETSKLLWIGCRDALTIFAAGSIVAIGLNALRDNGLPLIADAAYETIVPCPVAGGEVGALTATDPELRQRNLFWVDARLDAERGDFQIDGAEHVPYDYLDATPEATLRALAAAIARSGARRVVVFGDGDLPDSGEQLGKEISGAGIKHVYFVQGGAPALAAHRSEAAP